MQKILEEMLQNAVHFGHKTQKWDPRMRKYLYGEKDGIHIFNLEKTAQRLEEALSFLTKAVNEGKIVLFVSTKPQALTLIKNTANDCKMPYVISRWIPGFLTNFTTVGKRIKYLNDLESQEASGEFEKFTKKEASLLKKQIEKLKTSLGGVQHITRTPDVVVLVDAVRDNIVVKEANRVGIPVIAIVDSNANPDEVTYPIPGNDDAIKSITYLIGRIADVIQKVKKSN